MTKNEMITAPDMFLDHEKVRLLFVCLGNICRSPAAEAIAAALIVRSGLSDTVSVDSAGLHGYHEGEHADRRMIAAARERGYDVTSISRPIEWADFENFDLIIGMDDANIEELYRRAPTVEASRKIVRMRNFGTAHEEYDHVPDPYYGGSRGFELVLDLLEDSISDLLDQISLARNL